MLLLTNSFKQAQFALSQGISYRTLGLCHAPSRRVQAEAKNGQLVAAIQETRQKRATYNRITKSAPSPANREMPRFALCNRWRSSLV